MSQVRAGRAMLALLVAMRRKSRVTELWIGDSHALAFNQKVNYSEFVRGPEGQIILRVGPRLMYSLAEKGFPPRVHRIMRLVSRYGRAGSLVCVFVCGEIDVRCHLVGHEAGFGFVTKYVDRCMELASMTGSPRTVFVVPPPPSEWCPNVKEFPIRGTIAERVSAFEALRAALASEVKDRPGAVLLDASEHLQGPDGALTRRLTDDGCHVNEDGVLVVRKCAQRLDLNART